MECEKIIATQISNELKKESIIIDSNEKKEKHQNRPRRHQKAKSN